MFGVARFDGEVQIGIFDRHIEKESMMGNVDDIAAGTADQRGDACQRTRLVGTLETEGDKTPLAYELTLQHDS